MSHLKDCATVNTQTEITGAIATVKQLSGVYEDERIAVSETGWTSKVYIIDRGRVVFKFPRNEEMRNACKQEVAILQMLKSYSFDVHIPTLNWIAPDTSYFGFYGVEGKPLKELLSTLGTTDKHYIGTQLGQFLKQLHSIRDYGTLDSHTLEEQAAEYTQLYLADRELLTAYFSESQIQIIDDFFAYEVPAYMTGSGELVLCHGDLDLNNTFVDDNNQVGVIDFGDVGLYDRSRDFRGIEDRALRTAMMEAYGEGEIISLEAAEATAKMIDILNLPYIIKNRGTTERDECIARINKSFFVL